jgi:hypothetical protein
MSTSNESGAGSANLGCVGVVSGAGFAHPIRIINATRRGGSISGRSEKSLALASGLHLYGLMRESSLSKIVDRLRCSVQ